ncbi:hypothetical protein [Schlegelella koreensis]|uniref:Uncharacterized protein n=1 Tax=Piscinibacter koreensis TaxID=2742824 RepID=A0A7Y6NN96_9BURK|nr:hypothetical protein [Schlegelella koreensis]NUZ06285.1 hypothetical protein [Schlegelella koreensis]
MVQVRGTRRLVPALLAAWLVMLPALAPAQDAASLRARHAALRDKLANNPFQRPLVLEATQPSGGLKGDVYSIVEHPYPMVLQALQPLDNWCDILILHLNVKQCQAEPGELVLSVGRKFDQPVADAHRLEFKHRVAAATPEYLQVQLSADKGPFSTRDYRIVVEAIPLDAKRTFIHMSYAYAYGLAAKMATQTYLATLGRDKVGFTVEERKPDGTPVHVGGVVGLLERNTMRYYLAIDAYLAAFSLPPAEQVERRIQDWYAGTERYARQLHEMERSEYLEMKRKEIRRMDAAQAKR